MYGGNAEKQQLGNRQSTQMNANKYKTKEKDSRQLCSFAVAGVFEINRIQCPSMFDIGFPANNINNNWAPEAPPQRPGGCPQTHVPKARLARWAP